MEGRFSPGVSAVSDVSVSWGSSERDSSGLFSGRASDICWLFCCDAWAVTGNQVSAVVAASRSAELVAAIFFNFMMVTPFRYNINSAIITFLRV